MRRRRGYTLVEVMTVVAVLGAFLALISTTITTVLQLDATARREISLSQALGAWELQLREDLHQTNAVWLDGNMVKLRPDATHTVQWEAISSQMVRQLWEADSLITEERWPIPQDYQANWQIEDQMLDLSLLPDGSDSAKPLSVGREIHLVVQISGQSRSTEAEDQP